MLLFSPTFGTFISLLFRSKYNSLTTNMKHNTFLEGFSYVTNIQMSNE